MGEREGENPKTGQGGGTLETKNGITLLFSRFQSIITVITG